MIFKVLANGSKRFRACEIADEGHDPILALHLANESKIFLRRQITSSLPFAIGLGHQVRICRAAREASTVKIVSPRSGSSAKHRFVNLVYL